MTIKQLKTPAKIIFISRKINNKELYTLRRIFHLRNFVFAALVLLCHYVINWHGYARNTL